MCVHATLPLPKPSLPGQQVAAAGEACLFFAHACVYVCACTSGMNCVSCVCDWTDAASHKSSLKTNNPPLPTFTTGAAARHSSVPLPNKAATTPPSSFKFSLTHSKHMQTSHTLAGAAARHSSVPLPNKAATAPPSSFQLPPFPSFLTNCDPQFVATANAVAQVSTDSKRVIQSLHPAHDN